jgi:hypothetical protein
MFSCVFCGKNTALCRSSRNSFGIQLGELPASTPSLLKGQWHLVFLHHNTLIWNKLVNGDFGKEKSRTYTFDRGRSDSYGIGILSDNPHFKVFHDVKKRQLVKDNKTGSNVTAHFFDPKMNISCHCSFKWPSFPSCRFRILNYKWQAVSVKTGV